MNLFRKLIGRGKSEGNAPAKGADAPQRDLRDDPNMVRVFDGYGREMFIAKEDWKNNVLLGNLEKVRDKPDELYSMLVHALGDGFASEITPFAEHLAKTDPVPSRGATILGIVYLETDRLDEAERVLRGYLDTHGDDGVVLTNLAKVLSERGDQCHADATLWHALEVEPNQENGLQWFVALQRERHGEAKAVEACERVAALPGSWRARLWLARMALDRNDVAAADAQYAAALSVVGVNPPSDMLMQISGDLGQHGHLRKAIELVEPCFDPAQHGVQVGNNLIKAHLELDEVAEARAILESLYALKRPDYRETLEYWQSEIAKHEVRDLDDEHGQTPSISLMAIEGPLWSRNGSPFASLLPKKIAGAARVAIFGSTVAHAAPSEQPRTQLADSSGRLSRALPLLLTEKIHLSTDAVGVTLIPWAMGKGFAVFGNLYDDHELCRLATQSKDAATIVVGVLVDARREPWRITLRALRIADEACIAEVIAPVQADNPGPVAVNAVDKLIKDLAKKVDVQPCKPPAWYQVAGGSEASDYLLRLEQQLAVACNTFPHLEGAKLTGEREILDGTLQMCLGQKQNQTARLLFAETLRLMRMARPNVVSEYQDKVQLFLREHDDASEIGALIADVMREATA